MPDFILFDRSTNKARSFQGDDWFLGCVDTIKAENPQAAPIPVTDAEPKARFIVYFNSPALDKALAKAKSADDVPTILTDNGGVAGYVFLDRPSLT